MLDLAAVRKESRLVKAAPGVGPTQHQSPLGKRATGKLEVTSGDRSCSLYILFGHLFHAESGSFKGEDALQAALAWGPTSSEFDPSAHLPSEETFLRPTA